MQEQRARQILVSLIQGNDPLTGEDLPQGTVLQHADVLRALLAGVSAMEEKAKREVRRANLPANSRKPWDQDELIALVGKFQSGTAVADIATQHGRSVAAIETRLQKLGFISSEERTTPNRFAAPK